MDYGDEVIKKVIQDLKKTPSYEFEDLYGYIDIIISGLEEVITYRASLREAIRDDILTNGVARIDGSRLDTNDKDELTHGEVLIKWV